VSRLLRGKRNTLPSPARAGCALLLALVSVVPLAAAAPARAEPTPEPALRLQDAVAKAFAGNQELAAFEHRLAAQDGRTLHAGVLPNPVLGLEVEDFAGSGRRSGFDAAQTTLSVAWVLEGRRREGRRALEEARSSELRLQADILRLDVAAETARRFLDSLANQARLANADEALALASATVDAVGRRVRAGRSPSAELLRAEAELALARLDRDGVTHELAVSYHQLAAQWGSLEPTFPSVTGELLVLPEPAPLAALEARLERTPRVQRLASEERVAQADLRLAEARSRPVLRPLLGVRRYETTDDTALVAMVQVSLPVFDRNQARVAETRSRLSQRRAESKAARTRFSTTLLALHEEVEHHLHQAKGLRDEVIPRLTEAVGETRRAYARGRYGYQEWQSVQAELLRARSELVEAGAGAHRLVIALEQLTGEPAVQP
jgi:cobalt-zinc-cadmium efflux system outer membrane protein